MPRNFQSSLHSENLNAFTLVFCFKNLGHVCHLQLSTDLDYSCMENRITPHIAGMCMSISPIIFILNFGKLLRCMALCKAQKCVIWTCRPEFCLQNLLTTWTWKVDDLSNCSFSDKIMTRRIVGRKRSFLASRRFLWESPKWIYLKSGLLSDASNTYIIAQEQREMYGCRLSMAL